MGPVQSAGWAGAGQVPAWLLRHSPGLGLAAFRCRPWGPLGAVSRVGPTRCWPFVGPALCRFCLGPAVGLPQTPWATIRSGGEAAMVQMFALPVAVAACLAALRRYIRTQPRSAGLRDRPGSARSGIAQTGRLLSARVMANGWAEARLMPAPPVALRRSPSGSSPSAPFPAR